MKHSKLAFTNGVILTGEEDMQPIRGRILFTDGDRIEAIRPDGASTAGYEVIDLAGAAIMPGLVNLHMHIPAIMRKLLRRICVSPFRKNQVKRSLAPGGNGVNTL